MTLQRSQLIMMCKQFYWIIFLLTLKNSETQNRYLLMFVRMAILKVQNTHGLMVDNNPSVTSLAKQSYIDTISGSRSPKNVEVINEDMDSRNEVSVSGASGSDAFTLREQKSWENNVPWQHHLPFPLGGIRYQGPGAQAQATTQRVDFSHDGMEKVFHGYPKVSSAEFQPFLHPPGLALPLYGTAAAHMTSGNSYYPGLHPSGLYAPQYSVGGYPPSSAFLTPFLAGYPSHSGLAMQFGAASVQNFNSQSAGFSAGESTLHVVDLENISKFYGHIGHQGVLLQPSFLNPLQMQYFQHPAEDAYGASGQYGWLTSMGVLGSPSGSSMGEHNH